MNWNALWPQIEQAAVNTAKLAAKQYEDEARADAEAFVNRAGALLLKYTTQLAADEISEAEFADLVQGLKDLATLNALTEAGLGAVALQALRDAVVSAIIQVVLDAV